jgi:NAD(P)-dependent dehydrogenase (short-subunit alcohol dehydrogenase family)
VPERRAPPACYLVIGASRGLGLALVRELLARTKAEIIAVSRSPIAGEGRLRSVQADITQLASVALIQGAIANTPTPLTVILNAAAVVTEIASDGEVSFETFRHVNAVQIDGLGHVLEAVLPRLRAEGGAFVAISSFSAYAPPVQEPRIAYPASKAYLDMAMRASRLQWGDKVAFTTVHLGNMTEKLGGGVINPSYASVAAQLVERLHSSSLPKEINATWPYLLAYKYGFRWLPDRVYAGLMRRLFRK